MHYLLSVSRIVHNRVRIFVVLGAMLLLSGYLIKQGHDRSRNVIAALASTEEMISMQNYIQTSRDRVAMHDKTVLCNAVSGSQAFMCEIAVTRFKLQSCKLELERVNQIVAGMPGQIKYKMDAGPLLLQLRNIDEELDDAVESRMEHETSAKVNPVYLDEKTQVEAKAASILAQASQLQNGFVDVLKNTKSAAEVQVQVANWAICIIAFILLALAVVSRFCEVEMVESISGPRGIHISPEAIRAFREGPQSDRC
jgi:hypothetical protein